MLTRGGICVPPTVTYLPYCVSGSTLTAVGCSRLLDRWPGTHSRILSGTTRTAQTVLGVYLKRTCSRDTSASSALGVLNDYALYKSTHSLTHSLTQTARIVQQHHDHCHHPHTHNTASPCSQHIAPVHNFYQRRLRMRVQPIMLGEAKPPILGQGEARRHKAQNVNSEVGFSGRGQPAPPHHC